MIIKLGPEHSQLMIQKAIDISKAIENMPSLRKSELTNNYNYGACLGTQEIMRTALLEDMQIANPVFTLSALKSLLAKRESEAFYAMCKSLRTKELINFKELSAEVSISVSVFRSMISKLREKGMIKTTSHGSAGTEIEFYNPNILVEVEEEEMKL
jgi:GTP-sensing pleiotropic transcriptional regulator CodY